jgi:hypothetical protein
MFPDGREICISRPSGIPGGGNRFYQLALKTRL